MNMVRRLTLVIAFLLAAAPCAFAQSAAFRDDLLQLLPDDFAVCIVMNDLQGHAARWEKSDWLKQFHQSAIGKSVFDAPEWKQFEHWQAEVKKHLHLDWPTLRDDILGDTLVLSYNPGPKDTPDDERGLILLHVRKPDTLRKFIDTLNEGQLKSRELKSLTELTCGHTTASHRRRRNITFQGFTLRIHGQGRSAQGVIDRRSAAATTVGRRLRRPRRPSIF